MKNKGVAVLLVLLAAVLMVVPAAAQAQKTTHTIVICELAQLDPGTSWISGDNVLHIRNEVVFVRTYSDEPLLQGSTIVTRSFDINLKTGNAHVYASGTHEIDGLEGAWIGRASFHDSADAPYWGYESAHGTGDLKGLTYRASFSPFPPDYPGGPPCNGGLAEVTINDHRN